MIFKIQRPLYSTEDDPCCLVYNKDRSFNKQLHFTDLDDLFGSDLKLYVEGEITESKVLHIIKRVEEQDW